VSSCNCCADRTRSHSTHCRFIGSAFFLGRIDAEEPPGASHESGGLLSGVRWIRKNAIIRAELLGVATLNLFNFMFFALFLLYATRDLGVRPATIGIVLGSASIGTLAGSFVTARISRRIGVGPTFIIGCFLFPAPLILVPAASGPMWLVLTLLFIAEFFSGIGLMLLDIMAGTITAGTVPTRAALTRLRRVHGRELRRAPARHDTRRDPWHSDRRALDTLDRDRRRTARARVPDPSPIVQLRDVPAEAPE